ncbi:MAG: type II toxin-antitoxin system RelE/ParE family toxin [Luteimonas sp.]
MTRYGPAGIRTFRHKGLEACFRTGTTRGIQPAHKQRLSRQLFALNNAAGPQDMNVPGWRLHPLQGKLQEHWSVTVNGNWRLTFKFEDGDAILIDYQDYH